MSIAPVGLTVNESCAYIGLKRSSVYQLINSNKIKAVLIGGRRIVLRQSIDDYLASLVKDAA